MLRVTVVTGFCSPAKDAASAPQQNWQGHSRWFARVKEGKGFLSIFFQDRGKESGSSYTLCIKVEIKAFRGNTRLGTGSSCFLLPPTFLFTSLSSPIAGTISKFWRDLGSRLLSWRDVDCECGQGIWLHVIFPIFTFRAELGATFLKPALEKQAAVVSPLYCPGRLKFHWHKKVSLDCSCLRIG